MDQSIKPITCGKRGIPLKVFIEALKQEETPDDKSSADYISIGEKIYAL